MARFSLLLLSSVLFIFSSPSLSQPMPKEFFDTKSILILQDMGENWSSLSNFTSPRFQHKNHKMLGRENSDTLSLDLRAGLKSIDKNISWYSFGHLKYKKYFYGYLYPKLENSSKSFSHSAESLNGELSFGETYLSGIGYQNSWVWIQICRGYENWGAGNNISLALSNKNSGYDYLLLGSDYGRFRVNYLHGFLETIQGNINRYITARGIEWTNNINLVIGLSETIIYSGKKRSLDIGYINPISSHLEIELNDRLNVNGTNNSNAVWQAHFDLMINKRIRISGNLLFDELVIDPDKELEKEHGKAYSLKAVYGLKNSKKYILSIFSSFIKVGTPTFRHGNGMNNFVNGNLPLGWIGGSDGLDWQVGANYYNRKNIISSLVIKRNTSGEENILLRPYDSYSDYLKGPFPSGDVSTSNSLEGDLEWWWKKNFSFFVFYQIKHLEEKQKINSIRIGINAYIEKNLFL